MQRVRTFIAINPGKKVQSRLGSLQEALRKAEINAKWVDPDNMHLTLLFLGEVDLVAVPNICDAVGEVAQQHTAFPMVIAETGCFPNPRRPRVLWVGVQEGQQELIALHDALEKPLLDLGCYRREERKYKPHLTLGRISGAKRTVPDISPVLQEFANWHGGETVVDEVHVMSSELTPKGPIYTVLSRAQIG